MRSLLIDIERFLRQTGTTPTRFGREAVGDPCFVFEVRRGRRCGLKILERVYSYMIARDGRLNQCV